MSRKCVDLTGMKFGRLTVVERVENQGNHAMWLCECECGNMKKATGYNLKKGNVLSCGCLQKEKLSERRTKKLKGEKFGRLTVIDRAGVDKNGHVMWLCECECGSMKIVRGHDLCDGAIVSCGCYFKEKVSDRQGELNPMYGRKGDLSPQWKGGITSIRQHIRLFVGEWYDNCKQQANYECELTHKKGRLNVHHLYSLSNIIKDAHDNYDISIKDQIKDYTEKELELIKTYINEYHKDNSNAIVLIEDVHKLFHSLYGYGDNTPEQFEEFKERYLAGEFKEILK